ncbi:hypothetical protein SKAU_G00070370 [Synaphobranchus kaupii]|uniref:Fcf2 pre-rRNA processing C-terminal domain-containing protein n=1 Tax=Synaphobranchus kaupii TaxID=118154 RepID=A0A9Q1JBN9_SYNKA|nr:hypothetical protein SKAU_G00070370 [Synaphobranchus kaupii]
MVATRRGVRVSSNNIEKNESSVSMEATPATRRTRSKTVQEEPQSQSEVTSNSQYKEGEEGSASASPEMKSSTVKRKPSPSKRRTRNEDQPDSTHEADVSESESCSSVVSDLQACADVGGTRHRRRGALVPQKPSSGKEQDVLSEAESCCSSASAHQGQSARRATRSRQRSVASEGQPAKFLNAGNENSEAESCSSVVSGTKVLTRSQKRITLSRASSKSRTEDTELSDVDSCSSSLSGLQNSTLRRSTRSRRGRAVQPIAICLEENADGSPVPRRQTRRSRAKPESASEPQSHDSEGFESGPSRTPRRATRSQAASVQQGQIILSDSESETTVVYSPLGSLSSLRGRGTPCSSRTGSGSSVRAVSVPQITEKALNVLKEQDDTDASASSGPFVSEQLKSQEEERFESGTSDRPLDGTCQSATVIVTEAVDAEEEEEEEAVAMVVDSHVGPECSLIEEVSEDEKTLVGEEEECVSAAAVIVEDKVKPQMVQEAALVNETICRSTEVEEVNEEEKIVGVDLQVALEHTLMEDDQESERPTSKDDILTPGMLEEKTDQDEQLHIAEDIVSPSPAVKVIVSNAALSIEEKVKDDNAMDVDSTVATVCQKLPGLSENDNSLDEEGESVIVGVAEKTEPGIAQKADYSIILLESSDEEGKNSESGHLGRESGDEKDSKGSDNEEEIICPDENLAGPSQSQETSQLMLSDGLFVIDTQPGFQSDGKYYLDQEKMGEDEGVEGEEFSDIEDEQDEEFVDEEGDEDDDTEDSILFKSKSKDLIQLSTSIDPGLKVKDIGGLYISVDGSKSKSASNAMKKLKEQKDQDELMKRSVIGPEFEKEESVPPYKESKQTMKQKRKAEREKTTGDGWFNMKAPEMTEELTNDLKVLKMRAAMDPKRFYKKNDRDGFPKYFQVGTVVDSPVDFYHSRIPKKQRKRTMVEELLADAEFRNYNKKKYKQIMTEKAAHAAGKKNRKKNKFRKKQGI